MEVYIWGTGELAQTCMEDLVPGVHVLGFVESAPGKTEFCGKKVIAGSAVADMSYDYMILANSHQDEIIKNFLLDEKRTVCYRMEIENGEDGAITCRRNNPGLSDELFQSQRKLEVTELARDVMPCISLQLEHVKFIFDHNDNLIPNEMIGYGKVYSKDEMCFFYEMAPKMEGGFFLDIGANVGTTSIYFKKNICGSLKYIAFEPLKENYKYLKMNCILNDCEDIKAENIGMSNTDGQKRMFVFDGAFGSSMVSDGSEASDLCEFTTLDQYIQRNQLSADDIGYLWVDVQCHELEVLEGAKKTLTDSRASLFIEFNVGVYREEGKCEKFLGILKDIYSKFICYEQYANGRKEVRAIEELFELPKEINAPFCNILLMK